MSIREKVILDAEEKVSEEFKKAGGGADEFGKKLDKLAKGVLAGVIVKKVADLGKAVVGLAIDAREAKSAFDTTFGEALPEATAFVDEFANKAGFATFELEQMLSTTGSVAQGLGATEEESARLSESMARLAGDVASFRNAAGGAEAVLMALQSATTGEREALKTYGIVINETDVQQRALLDTGKAHVKELTKLEKAQATITLAYELSGKAIGDLDRTQDDAAGSLRTLGAKIREAGAEIGEGMLPALEDLLPVIEDIIPAATDAAVAIAGLVASFGPGFGTALEKATDVIDGLAFATGFLVTTYAHGRTILEEVFSFGLADTTNLQAMAKTTEHAMDVREAVRKLREEQVPGANAATRYANQLVDVAQKSDLSADAISRLGAASGGTAEEQLDGLLAVRAYADERNWRTDNIIALIDAIVTLQIELGIIDDDFVDAGLRGHDFAEGIGDVGDKAEAVVEPLTEAQQAVLDLAEAAEEGAAAFRDDLAQEAGDFITGFEKLPKRIKISMDKFEKNLTDRISASAEFWANLAVLAEAGFGDLAEEIRSQGPDAAGLLEDLVGDLERAAELDDIISAAGDQMAEVTDAYATALETRGDPALTAMGTYGKALIDAIADGIRAGNLGDILIEEVGDAVRRVTGINVFNPPPEGPPGEPFQTGTWAVPGAPSDDVAAVVHGTEIIIPPEGSGGRAEFARQLAVELGRSLGTEGPGSEGSTVHIEQITVLVPPGTTINEAVTAAGAEAAIEALLS